MVETGMDGLDKMQRLAFDVREGWKRLQHAKLPAHLWAGLGLEAWRLGAGFPSPPEKSAGWIAGPSCEDAGQ